MDVRTGGGEGCILGPKGAVESRAFAISGPEMVDFVQVVRVTEVDFIGGDANDGACYYVSSCAILAEEVSFTVLFMQFIHTQVKPASVQIMPE